MWPALWVPTARQRLYSPFTDRRSSVLNTTNALERMRGTDAAAALVEHMISDVRVIGFKMIPICPYVQAQYKRHLEWMDVRATSTSS